MMCRRRCSRPGRWSRRVVFPTGGPSVRRTTLFALTWLVVVLLLASWPARATSPTISGVLERFVSEAKKAGLPTRFIEAIPADFVTVEFDDLHAFAAEYHLDDHRLVLNQALSFN